MLPNGSEIDELFRTSVDSKDCAGSHDRQRRFNTIYLVCWRFTVQIEENQRILSRWVPSQKEKLKKRTSRLRLHLDTGWLKIVDVGEACLWYNTLYNTHTHYRTLRQSLSCIGFTYLWGLLSLQQSCSNCSSPFNLNHKQTQSWANVSCFEPTSRKK